MCFAQAVSTEHFHATDDIEQTCVVCRFSDNNDALAPSSIETESLVLRHEHVAKLYVPARIEASFDYRARAPPFSSHD